MTTPLHVPDTDNFEQWRVKTNQISDNVGNPTDLTTTDKSSLVAAVNESRQYAIAIAIALS